MCSITLDEVILRVLWYITLYSTQPVAARSELASLWCPCRGPDLAVIQSVIVNPPRHHWSAWVALRLEPSSQPELNIYRLPFDSVHWLTHVAVEGACTTTTLTLLVAIVFSHNLEKKRVRNSALFDYFIFVTTFAKVINFESTLTTHFFYIILLHHITIVVKIILLILFILFTIIFVTIYKND